MSIDSILAVYDASRDALQMLLASASPLAFFGLMALLPAIGVPISLFLLLCGGYGWTTALCGMSLALLVNLSLSYALAHSLARPILQKLVGRAGYRIPVVTPANQLQVLLIVRLTPGIPYPLQNYLLGMTRVPFGLYLAVSFAIMLCWAIAFMLLGESFFSGNAGIASAGLLLLLLLSAAAHRLVRSSGQAE